MSFLIFSKCKKSFDKYSAEMFIAISSKSDNFGLIGLKKKFSLMVNFLNSFKIKS